MRAASEKAKGPNRDIQANRLHRNGRFRNIWNMVGQVRRNVEGGWYSVNPRGMGRREIFSCDREPFIGRLQGLVERDCPSRLELCRVQVDPAPEKAFARRPETEVDVSEGLGWNWRGVT